MPSRTATAPATFYLVQGNNDTYWRGDVPANAVGAKVVKIPHEDGERIVGQPNLDSPFRWYLTEDGADYPDHEGAAVWGRPDSARTTHAVAMAANGCRIVAEVDDNYTADRKFNAFMRERWTEGNEHWRFVSALSAYDAVITTTRWLRDQYVKAMRTNAKRERKRLVRPEMYVIGNHVDPDDWPTLAPKGERLRIGWMGSSSHRAWDMKLIYQVCAWAAGEGHEVIFIGHDPLWRPQTDVKRRLSFGFDYTFIPWVDPREFRRGVGYPLDIALIPLAVNEFNLGKSDVKFLEMAMSGATVVASNMPVYNNTIRHGETALLAGSDGEFLHMVKELVRTPRLRRELAEAAAQYVRENRLIGQHAHEWREAIEGSLG